jgi:predicted nuclease with TOPRIM domain
MNVIGKYLDKSIMVHFWITVYFLDSLREELKAQSSEMIGLQHRLNDAQISITELQTKQMPLQLELTKFQREKEYLEQQVNTFQQELSRKNEEDRKYRGETTQKIFQLESKLAECQMELEEKSREAAFVKVSIAFCMIVTVVHFLLYFSIRINFKFNKIALIHL